MTKSIGAFLQKPAGRGLSITVKFYKESQQRLVYSQPIQSRIEKTPKAAKKVEVEPPFCKKKLPDLLAIDVGGATSLLPRILSQR